MLRIYLKQEVSEEQVTDLLASMSRRVETDNGSAERYISVYDDPFSLTFAMREIPAELVDRFTSRATIENMNSFRTDGIYRHEGAELQCNSEYQGGMGDYDSGRSYQAVDVVAPTLAALQEIYFKFRKGELLPDENWEAPQVKAETAETSVE